MDTKRFDQLSQDLSTSIDRRRVVQGIGALATSGLALLTLGRTAFGRNREVEPRNDAVSKRCLTRCQKHNNGNNGNCHRQCRRGRK